MTQFNEIAVPSWLQPTELARRSDIAFGMVQKAVTEYSYWSLQRAYATLRAEFPTATSIMVDESERPLNACWIERVHAGDQRLWSPNKGVMQVDATVDEAGVYLEEALRFQPPHSLPGWTERKRKSGIYTVDLTALPPALSPGR